MKSRAYTASLSILGGKRSRGQKGGSLRHFLDRKSPAKVVKKASPVAGQVKGRQAASKQKAILPSSPESPAILPEASLNREGLSDPAMSPTSTSLPEKQNANFKSNPQLKHKPVQNMNVLLAPANKSFTPQRKAKAIKRPRHIPAAMQKRQKSGAEASSQLHCEEAHSLAGGGAEPKPILEHLETSLAQNKASSSKAEPQSEAAPEEESLPEATKADILEGLIARLEGRAEKVALEMRLENQGKRQRPGDAHHGRQMPLADANQCDEHPSGLVPEDMYPTPEGLPKAQTPADAQPGNAAAKLTSPPFNKAKSNMQASATACECNDKSLPPVMHWADLDAPSLSVDNSPANTWQPEPLQGGLSPNIFEANGRQMNSDTALASMHAVPCFLPAISTYSSPSGPHLLGAGSRETELRHDSLGDSPYRLYDKVCLATKADPSSSEHQK